MLCGVFGVHNDLYRLVQHCRPRFRSDVHHPLAPHFSANRLPVSFSMTVVFPSIGGLALTVASFSTTVPLLLARNALDLERSSPASAVFLQEASAAIPLTNPVAVAAFLWTRRGVADDVKSMRIITSISDGYSTMAGSLGSCCGFSLAARATLLQAAGGLGTKGPWQTTTVALGQSLTIPPLPRRSVLVFLGLDRCGYPAALIASLLPMTSASVPGDGQLKRQWPLFPGWRGFQTREESHSESFSASRQVHRDGFRNSGRPTSPAKILSDPGKIC